MNRPQLTGEIRALALECGFDRVAIARAHARQRDQAHLDDWIAAGHHGQMHWLAKNTARRSDPGLVVEGASSVIVLAVDYDSDAPRSLEWFSEKGERGWISRYAWGDDYHRVIDKRLKLYSQRVHDEVIPRLGRDFGSKDDPRPWSPRLDFRFYVDHGPVLERAWAAEAGLGWRGKHGLIVDPARGSYFFLAVVVTVLDLVPDAPIADHCGSCTACVDVCPTDAILPTRSVDSRQCISYLTIEAPLPLSAPEQAALNGHVFGCDLCQDVCPFNRFSTPGDPAFAPRAGLVAPALADLTTMDNARFADTFVRSAVKRRKASGLREMAEYSAFSKGQASDGPGSD